MLAALGTVLVKHWIKKEWVSEKTVETCASNFRCRVLTEGFYFFFDLFEKGLFCFSVLLLLKDEYAHVLFVMWKETRAKFCGSDRLFHDIVFTDLIVELRNEIVVANSDKFIQDSVALLFMHICKKDEKISKWLQRYDGKIIYAKKWHGRPEILRFVFQKLFFEISFVFLQNGFIQFYFELSNGGGANVFRFQDEKNLIYDSMLDFTKYVLDDNFFIWEKTTDVDCSIIDYYDYVTLERLGEQEKEENEEKKRTLPGGFEPPTF